jgi:hypothetical protein
MKTLKQPSKKPRFEHGGRFVFDLLVDAGTDDRIGDDSSP